MKLCKKSLIKINGESGKDKRLAFYAFHLPIFFTKKKQSPKIVVFSTKFSSIFDLKHTIVTLESILTTPIPYLLRIRAISICLRKFARHVFHRRNSPKFVVFAFSKAKTSKFSKFSSLALSCACPRLRKISKKQPSRK